MAINQLTEYMTGRKAQGFTPHSFYSKEGDFLTYYFCDEDFYADRIDDILTIYRTMDQADFVGFKLKGIRHLLDTLGDFTLQVRDGDGALKLGMLFLAGMSLIEHPPVLEYYQRLANETKEILLRRDELQPVGV